MDVSRPVDPNALARCVSRTVRTNGNLREIDMPSIQILSSQGGVTMPLVPRSLVLWMAAVMAGLLCSCAAPGGRLSKPVSVRPFSGEAAEDAAYSASAPETAPRQARGQVTIQLTGHSEPATPAAGSHIRTVAGEQPVPVAATFTPASRRIDNPQIAGQACPIGCQPVGGCPPLGGQAAGVAVVGPRGIHPDEYLCDGGDRLLPIHYDHLYRNGLNTEDTVAEWTDPAGGHHVVPSNKVCVYAPRFGEVRTFTAPVGGTKVTSVVRAGDVQQGVGLNARTYLDTEVQELQLNTARVRSRASGVRITKSASGFGQATSIALNLKTIPPAFGTAFLTSGVLREGEEAFIADGIDAAVGWTRAQFPVITGNINSAHEVHAEFRAAEFVGAKDMDKPGRLRIVKIADKKAASSGDVVTFTIRYDNLGDKPVYHVRIVDNLTPRLDFIEDSGTSDQPGHVEVEPNGEGSVVLTFVIEKPVEGKSGGTVSFQARVR